MKKQYRAPLFILLLAVVTLMYSSEFFAAENFVCNNSVSKAVKIEAPICEAGSSGEITVTFPEADISSRYTAADWIFSYDPDCMEAGRFTVTGENSRIEQKELQPGTLYCILSAPEGLGEISISFTYKALKPEYGALVSLTELQAADTEGKITVLDDTFASFTITSAEESEKPDKGEQENPDPEIPISPPETGTSDSTQIDDSDIGFSASEKEDECTAKTAATGISESILPVLFLIVISSAGVIAVLRWNIKK